MFLGERCSINDRGPRGQCTHPRGFFFGSISAYHTRSRRLLEWVIHTSTRVIVQATTPLVSAKIKDEPTRDKVGRQSVRRLQSLRVQWTEESDYSRADAERRRGTGRLGPVEPFEPQLAWDESRQEPAKR